jgi:hypothetical protein
MVGRDGERLPRSRTSTERCAGTWVRTDALVDQPPFQNVETIDGSLPAG